MELPCGKEAADLGDDEGKISDGIYVHAKNIYEILWFGNADDTNNSFWTLIDSLILLNISLFLYTKGIYSGISELEAVGVEIFAIIWKPKGDFHVYYNGGKSLWKEWIQYQ